MADHPPGTGLQHGAWAPPAPHPASLARTEDWGSHRGSRGSSSIGQWAVAALLGTPVATAHTLGAAKSEGRSHKSSRGRAAGVEQQGQW